MALTLETLLSELLLEKENVEVRLKIIGGYPSLVRIEQDYQAGYYDCLQMVIKRIDGSSETDKTQTSFI